MDMVELLKMGAKMFIASKRSGDAGSGLDIGNLTSALSSIAGGGSSSEGFDLGSLLSKMDSGGLGGIVQSWLGDGENESVSPEQISNVLGADKISEFASQLDLITKRRLVVYLRHFRIWWIRPAVVVHYLIQSVAFQALSAWRVNYLASRPSASTHQLFPHRTPVIQFRVRG